MNKFFLIYLIFIPLVFAHQPRLPIEYVTQIENPEISQAFYSELTGEPHFYELESADNFSLYVGILVPAIENIEKDISVEIYFNNEFYYLLNASESDWPIFYEEFGGDLYYWGPEFGSNEPLQAPKGIPVNKGEYIFKVFSEDNEGKYVFVIGEKEEFPLNEMINTIIKLPKIKKFFNKSPLTAYFNKAGQFLLIPLLLIIGIILFWALRKKSKQPSFSAL